MAENKLSWTELRRALASRAGVSEKEANAFLNAFNAQLVEALKADKQVKINGLGTFKLQAVAPRKSVNVKTGAEITIEGYNKIAFTPEAGVKELVESNQSSEVSHSAEVDPLKKLGAQAEEIVDILGELGQSPKGEYQNSHQQTHPVGTKKPNELGLYDMSGNVWELCSDIYAPYPAEAQFDPQGPAYWEDNMRVVRGGNCGSIDQTCRLYYRSHVAAPYSGLWVGLRVACMPFVNY